MLYLRLAKQHYDQQGAIKDQNMHMAKHTAALFLNERVTPEEIMDRASAGDGLGMKKDVSGAAARGKAQGIWRDLVCIAYQEGIEVKSFDQKSVIEHCQDMEKTFRACKKGRDKPAKERIKMVPLATAKSEVLNWVRKANYKQINLTDFQRMQANRTDVRWQKPFDTSGSGYGGKAGTVEPKKFQKWMDECTYDALAPLWHLKAQMGGTSRNI